MPKTSKVIRLTPKAQLEELRAYVQLCLTIILEECDGDFKEASNLTGLHSKTVHRYSNGQFTVCSHYGTIQRLGAAAGLKLTLTEYGATVRVVDNK